MRVAVKIELSEADRKRLQRWSRSAEQGRTLAAALCPYSDDSDHRFRQNDHRFRRIPITFGGERRSIGALRSGYGFEV